MTAFLRPPRAESEIALRFRILALFRRRQVATVGDIEILGDREFCARTLEALRLLSFLSGFEVVREHIALIKQAARSGMRAWARRPTFAVGQPTWKHSILWYAGAIAHDAYHSKLYHEARSANGGRQPDADTWTGTDAEKECLIFQRQVLIDLNADRKIIAYLEEQLENPTYGGRNKGFGAWLDYLKRWW